MRESPSASQLFSQIYLLAYFLQDTAVDIEFWRLRLPISNTVTISGRLQTHLIIKPI